MGTLGLGVKPKICLDIILQIPWAKAEPQPASVEIKEQILKEGWGQRGGKGLLKTNHRLKFCSVYVFIYIITLKIISFTQWFYI